MAVYNRVQVGLRETGATCTVPADPRAKLMYYLDCVCAVLRIDDLPGIQMLRRYQNYNTLSNADVDVLMELCVLLNPSLLINKCFFQDDALCGDSANKFFELEMVRNSLIAAGSVVIGGVNRQVTKIMTFKMSWFRDNWENPLKAIPEQRRREQIRRQQEAERRRQEEIRRQQEARRRQLERERNERWGEEQRQRQKSSTCTIL